MVDRIKYLNYKILKSGRIVHEGTVPEIFTVSGIEKQFNLGGVWIWHTCPEPTILRLSDGNKTVDLLSERMPETWFNYLLSHDMEIPNPHVNKDEN
jgi:hypothetical protein